MFLPSFLLFQKEMPESSKLLYDMQEPILLNGSKKD